MLPLTIMFLAIRVAGRAKPLGLLRICLLAACCRTAPAAEPIPIGEDAVTMTRFAAEHGHYLRALITEPFLDRCNPEAPWRGKAQEFLDLVVLEIANAPGRTVSTAAAAVALQRDCDDPVVKWGYGYLLAKAGNGHSLRVLQEAIEGLQAIDAPPAFQTLACRHFALVLKKHDQEDGVDRYLLRACDMLVRAAPEAKTRVQQRMLVHLMEAPMRQRVPIERLRLMMEAVEADPAVDEWLRLMLRGVYWIRLAWDARTARQAALVEPEQWIAFRDRLEVAKRDLEQAHALDASCPEAAAALITVAMGDPQTAGRDPRYWFDQAVRAQMDWPDAYARYLWSLRPRWGGSYEALMEFGRECAATERYDTLVPYQFFLAVLEICADSGDYAGPWKRPEVYAELAPLLTKTATNTAHRPSRNWFRSLHAALAWRVGNYRDAQTALTNLMGKYEAEAMQMMQVDLQDVLLDSYLFDGGFDAQTQRALQAEARGDYRSAALAWESALPLAESREKRRSSRHGYGPVRSVRHRLAAAKIARDLADGQWVDFRFEKGLPGWRQRKSSAEPLSETAVKVHASGRGTRLVLDAPVGQRWELEGVVDVTGIRGGLRPLTDRNVVNAAILIAYDNNPKWQHWQAVMFWPEPDLMQVRWRFYQGLGTSSPAAMDERLSFRVQVWDDKVSVAVNGREVFAGFMPRVKEYAAGRQFGLAGKYVGSPGHIVFENLRMRLLTEEPAWSQQVQKLEPDPEIDPEEPPLQMPPQPDDWAFDPFA